jgi:hypothetical protein
MPDFSLRRCACVGRKFEPHGRLNRPAEAFLHDLDRLQVLRLDVVQAVRRGRIRVAVLVEVMRLQVRLREVRRFLPFLFEPAQLPRPDARRRLRHHGENFELL